VFARGQRGFANKALEYASRAAYPFYVLHQTVIVIIGTYVVKWDIGVLPQFLIINVGSVLAILLTYEVLVNWTRVTRFLFGIKAKRREKRHGLPNAVRRGT
jgi:glucan biosynthesis protein C